MLSLAPGLKIYLYRKPTDMRRSFDGLYGIVKNEFSMDVRCGGLFLFINKRRTMVKCMYWDTDGIAIWMKRLEQGSLQHPQPSSDTKHLVMDTTQLHLLLTGIELSSVKRRKRYVAPELAITDSRPQS
jgi:transposase